MIIESVISAIFVLSFGGVILILIRKIPVLSTLSQNGRTGIKKHQIILNAESQLKRTIDYFEKQILLHKFLSWTKCLILKIEARIDVLLHRIRKRAKEEKLSKKK